MNTVDRNIQFHSQLESLLAVDYSVSRIINAIACENGQLAIVSQKGTAKVAYKPGTNKKGPEFTTRDNNGVVRRGGGMNTPGLAFWYWAQAIGVVLDFAPNTPWGLSPTYLTWLEKFKLTPEEKAKQQNGQ